jgi:hypothetical protein
VRIRPPPRENGFPPVVVVVGRPLAVDGRALCVVVVVVVVVGAALCVTLVAVRGRVGSVLFTGDTARCRWCC